MCCMSDTGRLCGAGTKGFDGEVRGKGRESGARWGGSTRLCHGHVHHQVSHEREVDYLSLNYHVNQHISKIDAALFYSP